MHPSPKTRDFRHTTSFSGIVDPACRRPLIACLVYLALLAWLGLVAAPAAAQEPPTISVTGSGGLVEPGGEVTYHLRLLNWTDQIIPGGVISHTLPAGFHYLSGSTQVTVGGWPITHTEPISQAGTLTWGPVRLPAAGHTAHNPFGVHTFVQDMCLTAFIDFQLDQALAMAGSGGYVTQLFYCITPETSGPDPCAVYFVNAAYDRNLVPILRLQGTWNPVGFWEKPQPGPAGDYAPVADAFARYVAGLPRRNTQPLYVTIWNEPDLWVEWSGAPNAQEYGRFFVAVSKAIRRLNDPRIRILNGAVTPANTTFIRRLLAVPGFVSAFDAWASHCYPYNHPPWYNIHQRTARYGNTVIDCYIEERDVIALYGGRTGLKFVLTETGQGLGDNLYAFEGFPPINEANRSGYMASAFRDYWRTWSEVIAVTPFELGDPWSGWDWLDWVDYRVGLDPFSFAYTSHPQYEAVAALAEPRGATLPHGVEVTFRARVTDDVLPGVYTSRLAGSALGASVVLSQAAPVQVVEHVARTYLPVIAGGWTGGVWTMGEPSAPPVLGLLDSDESTGLRAWDDGAIVPTHFLAGGGALRDTASRIVRLQSLDLGGAEPTCLVLDGRGAYAYVGLAGGELAVFDADRLAFEGHVSLGGNLLALAPGPATGLVYVALDSGELLMVDAGRAAVIGRAVGLGRPISLLYNPERGDVLVADAGTGRLVRLRQDLGAQLSILALDDLPGQVLLDTAARRLYVMLPGAGRVLALHADTLQPLAQVRLAGGPLVHMALDAAGGRLYVLSALSPHYRGIAVLGADDLSPLALVAGSPDLPLEQAAALALSSDGALMVAERKRVYLVRPDDFGVVAQIGLEHALAQAGLAVDPTSGRAVGIGPAGIFAFSESWPK
jgi:hypothetical protein